VEPLQCKVEFGIPYKLHDGLCDCKDMQCYSSNMKQMYDSIARWEYCFHTLKTASCRDACGMFEDYLPLCKRGHLFYERNFTSRFYTRGRSSSKCVAIARPALTTSVRGSTVQVHIRIHTIYYGKSYSLLLQRKRSIATVCNQPKQQISVALVPVCFIEFNLTKMILTMIQT
jgi:hypothetical protein